MNTDLSPLQTNLPLKIESIYLQGVNGSPVQELIGGQRKVGN